MIFYKIKKVNFYASGSVMMLLIITGDEVISQPLYLVLKDKTFKSF